MRNLTNTEVQQVSGGFRWQEAGFGLAIVATGVAIVGTAGLATIPLGIMGAATIGEIGVASTGVAMGFGGGALIGDAFVASNSN